jgi:hypothetical protein
MIDQIAPAFRELCQWGMTDKFSVKRRVEKKVDEYGFETNTEEWQEVYTDVKCRVSMLNQNFNNPNNENDESIPVLYKLKVFAPQDIIIKAGDLITLTRTVNGVATTYKDKRASDYMQYDNTIEFYIGINEEA